MALQIIHNDPLPPPSDGATLSSARGVLKAQAEALGRVADQLGPEFCHAIDIICRCSGRVVVCGVGKSGLIGKKIAATLACSGTPSLFLHAADAAHGDLGMVTHADVLLLISHSGSTDELLRLLPHFEELGVPIISLVGHPASPLALAADVAICTQVEREACPHNVLVTTSALVTLALADALALAVMQHHNVSVGDLGRRHPRGALGRRLTRRVGDVMRRDSLPLVAPETKVREALLVMAASHFGLLVVVDALRAPIGVVTPEDLSAGLSLDDSMLDEPIACLMTPDPVTVSDQVSLHAAYERIMRLGEKALIVVDAEQRVSGILLDERGKRGR